MPGATLQVLDSKGNILEEWISTAEPHDILALHDETQGLKDGTYTLREITSPYGYDIAEDVIFTVSSHKIENNVEMKNAPIEIETNAKDAATQSHIGKFSAEEKIIDVVTFSNIYAGREYTFSGTLMDKETGKELMDKDGKPVTAERTVTFDEKGNIIKGEYTGEKGVLISGSVELEFTVDASEFTRSKSIVAFEKLLREDHELAIHANWDDEDQTIHYGGIAETSAVDEDSQSHNLLAGKNAAVIDTVEYRNLAPGETYVVAGELYDKTSGRLTGITAETSFTPDYSDGNVTVLFRFDATDYASHTLVAFEKLSHKGIEIDLHEDSNDDEQTIYVPEISTKLGGVKDSVITDVVSYKNLIPGKTYTLSGYLVQRENERPVLDSSGSITFVPQTPDGEVKVMLNSEKGHGTVVAFEYLYLNGEGARKSLVGEHTDITSKDQTYTFPSSPKTGDDTMLLLYAGIFILGTMLCILRIMRLFRR